jgi:hypothetical protein
MNPFVETGVNIISASPIVTTEDLLRSLRASPTDLAKLVRRVDRNRSRVVAVSTPAVARWNKEDPESWQRVGIWLTARGVRIIQT